MYEGSATVEGSQAWRCAQDHATALIHLERVGRVVIDGVEHDDVPVYGVICTGAYSYIWNSGYFFGENDGQPRANETEDGSKAITTMHQAEFTANEQTISGFRLLKVKDDKRGVCKNAIWNSRASGQTNGGDGVRSSQYYNSDGYDGSLSYRFGTAGQAAGGTGYVDYFASFDPDSQSEVLLDNSATNPLALYDFTISNPVVNSDGEASFYSVSFILGTLTGGINIKSVGNFCKTPEDFEQDFDYCAINKFNFAAQATGG